MAWIGKIRVMWMRDGKSISEISRLTSLPRNTAKRWLNEPLGVVPKYRQCDVSTKLAPFVATLTQALEVDARGVSKPGATRCCATCTRGRSRPWEA